MDPDLDEDKRMELLNRLSLAMLPAQHTRSRLRSLKYNLTCKIPHADTVKRPIRIFPRTFTIPLDGVPSVSSLILTTFAKGRVSFTRGENYNAGKNKPANLHELRFRGC